MFIVNHSSSGKIKMAGCDTGFVEIDETWTQDKALRKYSSHKNWYAKYIAKVQNLKDLPAIGKTQRKIASRTKQN